MYFSFSLNGLFLHYRVHSLSADFIIFGKYYFLPLLKNPKSLAPLHFASISEYEEERWYGRCIEWIISEKGYVNIEKSFLIAMASMIGVSFASETPNLSIYI